MYIFILSTLLVSFIGLCFFKKKFWENRYLLLMIIGGVAIVATVTTNYIGRNNYALKTEVVRSTPLSSFYVTDSLLNDGIPYKADDFSFTSLSYTDIAIAFDTLMVSTEIAKDSFHVELDTILRYNASVFFYDMDEKEQYKKIGYVKENGARKYRYWEDIYLLPTKDSVPAKAVLKLAYDIPSDSKWVTKYSVPRRKTFTCFYIPEAEYNAIPDSLIRELPVKL